MSDVPESYKQITYVKTKVVHEQFLEFAHCFFFPDRTLVRDTDYGCPMEPFFIEIPNFWTWADNLGR